MTSKETPGANKIRRASSQDGPEPGPLKKAERRLLLGLIVALAPLTAVAMLRDALSLPNALVGGVALLTVGLVTGVVLLLRPRAAGDWARPNEPPPTDGYDEPVPLDPLTSLPTFQPFSQRLLLEYERVNEGGGSAALVLVDINDLEQINAEFGFEVGDEVLRQVAETLVATKRFGDVVARMGDDEFALLLPDCDERGARAFIDRVQEHLSRKTVAVQSGDRATSIWFGICAGTAICDPLATSADDVLTAAVDDLNLAREERDRRRQRWQASA